MFPIVAFSTIINYEAADVLTLFPFSKLKYFIFQLWVAYAPCGSQHKDAVQITLEQIDLIKRFIEQYSGNFQYVTSAEGLVEAHKIGKIASVISVESGHSIGTSLAVLRMYYRY